MQQLLLILQMYRKEIIVATLALLANAPVLYYRFPYLNLTPDCFYVKGKTLQVLQGYIYIDPVSGYNTLHPPFYHMVLALFIQAGISFNTLLVIISIINLTGLFIFTYLIIRNLYNNLTALGTCCLLLFISEFMGAREVLLPVSFYFSLNFFLAGIYFLVTAKKTLWHQYGTFILWGIAFLISPIYGIFIICYFVYRILMNFGRATLLSILVFFITISPIFYQYYKVSSQGLGKAITFAFWRGWPDLPWIGDVITSFLSPTYHAIGNIPSLVALSIYIAYIVIAVRSRRLYWLVPLTFIAYLLTSYHFSMFYATRIHMILSIFIVAHVLSYLFRLNKFRILVWSSVAIVSVYSFYHHYANLAQDYEQEAKLYFNYNKACSILKDRCTPLFTPGERVLARKSSYLWYLLPNFPVHSLGAYRTLDYFQVSHVIAKTFEADYQSLLQCSDSLKINAYCEKYSIEKAFFTIGEIELPVFGYISKHWELLYHDGFFAVYRRQN